MTENYSPRKASIASHRRTVIPRENGLDQELWLLYPGFLLSLLLVHVEIIFIPKWKHDRRTYLMFMTQVVNPRKLEQSQFNWTHTNHFSFEKNMIFIEEKVKSI